jgi:hypothetical protein
MCQIAATLLHGVHNGHLFSPWLQDCRHLSCNVTKFCPFFLTALPIAPLAGPFGLLVSILLPKSKLLPTVGETSTATSPKIVDLNWVANNLRIQSHNYFCKFRELDPTYFVNPFSLEDTQILTRCYQRFPPNLLPLKLLPNSTVPSCYPTLFSTTKFVANVGNAARTQAARIHLEIL